MALSKEFYEHFSSRDDWIKLDNTHRDVLTLQKLAAECEVRDKVPVRQYLRGKLIKIYEDEHQAAYENSLVLENLRKAIDGITITCATYEWRLINDQRPLMDGVARDSYVVESKDGSFFTGKYRSRKKHQMPVFSNIDSAQKFSIKNRAIFRKNELEQMIGRELTVTKLESDASDKNKKIDGGIENEKNINGNGISSCSRIGRM